jgi:hypothetical protein
MRYRYDLCRKEKTGKLSIPLWPSDLKLEGVSPLMWQNKYSHVVTVGQYNDYTSSEVANVRLHRLPPSLKIRSVCQY